MLKLQQKFKNYYYDVYTERINKIALCSNDDKRLQTFDKITAYPYGTNAFKICESEMLNKYKWLILMIMPLKTKQNIIQSAVQFRSSIQNTDNRRFWIRKNKCTNKFNKQLARHW